MVGTKTKNTKWNDPNSPAYWNKKLKAEGLDVVTSRQVINRKKRTADAATMRRAEAQKKAKSVMRQRRRQAEAQQREKKTGR